MTLEEIFKFDCCIDKNGNKISNEKEINKVHVIDLSKFGLNKIPDFLYQFKNLNELYLNDNKIEKIDNLQKCKNLKYLELNNNIIEKIEGLDNLKKLLHLTIYNNEIIEIENLNKNKYLEYLNLSNNKINQIKNLDRLIYLKRLVLDSNQITDIVDLNNNINLIHLSLCDNKIKSFTFPYYLNNLETLYLINNKIEIIPKINKINEKSSKVEHLNKLIDFMINTNYIELSLEDLEKETNKYKKKEELKEFDIFLQSNPLKYSLFSKEDITNTKFKITIDKDKDLTVLYNNNINKENFKEFKKILKKEKSINYINEEKNINFGF